MQVDGDTAIRRSIEYRDTGVILGVTPRVNESGLVGEDRAGDHGCRGVQRSRSDVYHEARHPRDGAARADDRARRLHRVANDSVSKIPFLGDLPLFGPAFQSVDSVEDRTEIILTLTPRVMSDPASATQTVDSFLEAAWAVRAALLSRQDELPRACFAVRLRANWFRVGRSQPQSPAVHQRGRFE